jgi:hypothetical protein
MSRFYSIPGMAPSQPKENPRSFSLPDIHDEAHEAQLGEWLRSREGNPSHQTIGLDPGDKVHFRDLAGEDRPAIVIGEERDQRTGAIDLHVRASDPSGSGTYRLRFEGDTQTSMRTTDVRRIHE